MSLEYWKREKNFRALEKGYTRDPEGFPFWFLFKRLKEELQELEQEMNKYASLPVMDRLPNPIFKHPSETLIKECADVSNIVDYISSKASTNYPDKYIPNPSADCAGERT